MELLSISEPLSDGQTLEYEKSLYINPSLDSASPQLRLIGALADPIRNAQHKGELRFLTGHSAAVTCLESHHARKHAVLRRNPRKVATSMHDVSGFPARVHRHNDGVRHIPGLLEECLLELGDVALVDRDHRVADAAQSQPKKIGCASVLANRLECHIAHCCIEACLREEPANHEHWTLPRTPNALQER